MSGAAGMLAETMLGTQSSWLIVLAAFMGVSWLANWWASSSTSKPLQYLGLILFTVAETIIFAPLLFFTIYYSGDSTALLAKAGIVCARTVSRIDGGRFSDEKRFFVYSDPSDDRRFCRARLYRWGNYLRV